MKFPDFAAYRIRELAEQFHFDSLIGYIPNNAKMNHLMIKLFLVNLNLDHHNPQNRQDCVWSKVCDIKIFLPLQ